MSAAQPGIPSPWHSRDVSPAVGLGLLPPPEVQDAPFQPRSLFLEAVSWFHVIPCNWILHVPCLDGSSSSNTVGCLGQGPCKDPLEAAQRGWDWGTGDPLAARKCLSRDMWAWKETGARPASLPTPVPHTGTFHGTPHTQTGQGGIKPQSHDVFELSWCFRDPSQELLGAEDNPSPGVGVLVTPSLLLGDPGAPHLCHPKVTFHCRMVNSHLLFRSTNGAEGKTKPQWMARAGIPSTSPAWFYWVVPEFLHIGLGDFE